MAATWRLNFFFRLNFLFFHNSLETWYIGFQGLRVCWHCQFSRATENEAMAAIFIFLLQIPC